MGDRSHERWHIMFRDVTTSANISLRMDVLWYASRSRTVDTKDHLWLTPLDAPVVRASRWSQASGQFVTTYRRMTCACWGCQAQTSGVTSIVSIGCQSLLAAHLKCIFGISVLQNEPNERLSICSEEGANRVPRHLMD